MKPLGLSVWQLTTRAADDRGRRAAVRRRHPDAGLAREPRGPGEGHWGRSDPLIGDALQTVLDRGDFIPALPDEGPGATPAGSAPAPIETDPAIVTELIERSQASIAALKRDIRDEVRAGAVRLHPRRTSRS